MQWTVLLNKIVCGEEAVCRWCKTLHCVSKIAYLLLKAA